MASFNTPEVERAIENIEKGNYLEAQKLLMPLAESGNPKAQCNLANLYHFGWGVRIDGEKAIELYTKVAQHNIREENLSSLACQSLATIYTTGLPNIQPDPEKAANFSARAKELGFEM
jgi:TPR repeat protein